MFGLCRRSGFACFCLLGFAAAGCMQVPFVVPEINYAPGVDARCKRDDVHVYRVDLTQTMEIKEAAKGSMGDVVEHVEMTRILPSADGVTSPQLGVTFASGWRYVGVVNFTSSSTQHGVMLHFYRPGYETITLLPGEETHELHWKHAADLAAEVKALDELMSGTMRDKSATVKVRQLLESGRKSAAHREALLFGAGEYERLARELSMSDADESAMRRDLLREAGHLRALADGK